MAILTDQVSTGRQAVLPAKAGEPGYAMLNIALWRGDAAPPSNPQLPAPPQGQRAGGERRPPNPIADALMADRCTATVTARVSAAEFADWRAKGRGRQLEVGNARRAFAQGTRAGKGIVRPSCERRQFSRNAHPVTFVRERRREGEGRVPRPVHRTRWQAEGQGGGAATRTCYRVVDAGGDYSVSTVRPRCRVVHPRTGTVPSGSECRSAPGSAA